MGRDWARVVHAAVREVDPSALNQLDEFGDVLIVDAYLDRVEFNRAMNTLTEDGAA